MNHFTTWLFIFFIFTQTKYDAPYLFLAAYSIGVNVQTTPNSLSVETCPSIVVKTVVKQDYTLDQHSRI